MQQVFRLMVVLWLSLSLATVAANAGDIPARSPLGIDYMALTEGDAQLAGILLAGETEWMQSSAREELGSDAGVEFEDNANLLKKEKVTKGMVRDLMEYTPQMLLSFIDLPKERYPLLQAIGSLVKADAELVKANAESEKLDEMLEQARALAGALDDKK